MRYYKKIQILLYYKSLFEQLLKNKIRNTFHARLQIVIFWLKTHLFHLDLKTQYKYSKTKHKNIVKMVKAFLNNI